jgi:hypothetical protein
VLGLTEDAASYLGHKFHAILARNEVPILPPLTMSTQLVEDCERAANVLARAFQNRCEFALWLLDDWN